MKVRIKFTKEGPMKFVGHLDTMRYFQKAVRRAELPIAFSGGYSPHMIMSFAAPLGVGVTSTAVSNRILAGNIHSRLKLDVVYCKTGNLFHKKGPRFL